MKKPMGKTQQGFTLIEIMIVLLVTAVALLALATLSLSVMDSGTESRERLNAVHLAEQVIEEWQYDSNDYYPVIASDCTMTTGTAVLSAASTSTCTPATGMNVSFTIVANVANADAPLPSDLANFQAMSAMTFGTTPMVKLVTVSWGHKGETKSIFLTHLTR